MIKFVVDNLFYMRNRFFALAFVLACVLISSCDLFDKTVLIDEENKTTIIDSTTIRVLSSVPDSTVLYINTTANWKAYVANSVEWCTISKNEGVKGKDTIMVHVAENIEETARQTSVVVESGNKIMVFRVNQRAGETWMTKPYWYRTDLQRLGMHGKVKKISVTDNRYSNEAHIYTFDEQGNLLIDKEIDKVANHYDTTKTYTFDEANHRLTCTVVTDWDSAVVRTYRYEYNNSDKLVAYSAKGWNEPDPLAEKMEGMIVPDLSYVYKSWVKGEQEFYEEREYTFEGDRLLIHVKSEMIKDGDKDWIVPLVDTLYRVSYQFSTACKLTLPYTSRGYVKNSVYYQNGMLKMMETVDGKYDYLSNAQKMAVLSYQYTGDVDKAHEIEAYTCEYNNNRDLTERNTMNATGGEILERYPQYEYDTHHNWVTRLEELWKTGWSEPLQYATKREIIYFE